MYDEWRFWDRAEYGGGGGRARGMAGRALIVSAGSSSHDLMRHKGAALIFPRGLGEGVPDGRENTAWMRDSLDEDGEIGGEETPSRFVSLLMSEKGARVSSIRRCFRGGVLQYGGGGVVGGAGVASTTGTPTGKATAVRGLLRGGMLKQITCGVCASVEECGGVFVELFVGGAIRTMDV
jgi:hypothetical protein